MKILAIIYSITNYVTKSNYSQYQHIMSVVIIRQKEYENAQSKTTVIGSLLYIRFANLNRYALNILNKQAYE